MSRLRDLEKPNKYKDFLRYIASIQVKHPFLTMALILTISIFLLGGVSQIRTVASLEKMMPTNIEEISAFNTLRDNHLGQDMLAVVVELDSDFTIQARNSILDYEYYSYVKSLKETVSSEDNVVAAYAFSDIVDSVSQMQVDEDNYYSIINNPLLQEKLSMFVNTDSTNTIIMISTDVSADDQRMNLLATKIKEDIESVGRPRSTKISITGTPVIQQKLGEIIEHDRHLTERLSALFVFVVVAIIFGSLIAAFVPMASILISIIWLYGMMGYLDLPISTLAGGVAAMVIGIGVDFSIHLRNKFEYERKKGESLEYSVEETMANTGYVLTIVTIVTAIAFLTFLLGEMPEMGRFGMLMAIGVTLAFILSVVGLPALFIIEEKMIHFVKEKLSSGIDKEIVLSEASKKHVKDDLDDIKKHPKRSERR
jgi:hypothetical protein